jgi:Icc protein
MTIRLLHLSDSHLKAGAPEIPPSSLADGVGLFRGERTAATFERVLRAAADAGPIDLAIHTGDIVDDAADASYAEAFEIVRASGLDVEYVPGNHDRVGALPAASGRARVRTRVIGVWSLVLVDSTVPGAEHGRFGPDALAELDDALGAVAGPTLVAMHHPPLSICADADCRIHDVEDLLEVLDRHAGLRVVISGHLHHAYERERGNVLYLSGPSTCMQLQHVHPLPDHNRATTPIGARLISLHDDGTATSELLWA